MKKTFALSISLFFIFGIGNAEAQDEHASAGKYRLVEHRFNLKDCPFSLKDKPGYALHYLDTGSRNSGVYRVIDNRKTDAGISISFICDEKPAQMLCPKKTNVVGVDESDQRYRDDIRIIRHDRINDTYYGVASAFNLSGTPRPWARKLIWCMGDDHLTLWGDSIVGDEKHEYTDRILKILHTIRFVDPLDPEHSESQDSSAPNDNAH